MTNDVGSAGDPAASSQTARSPKWVAYAALGGSLIGAMTGLVGSVLVYAQAENSQEKTAQQRVADIRRSTYTDFVSRFEDFRSEADGYRNLIIFEATAQQQESHFNDKVVPAYKRLTQSESLTRLVGTDSARADAGKLESYKEKVGTLFTEDELDVERYDKIMAEFREAVEKFVAKVDQEVI